MNQNEGVELSLRDQGVLEHIFDPEGGFPEANKIKVEEEEEQAEIVIPEEQLIEVKKLEAQALEHAMEEKEDSINKAIEILSKAIEICPDYASAYNNRAQAFRMIQQPEKSLEDLNLAIEKAHKTLDKNVLKQAYTQRGLHLKSIAKNEEEEANALRDFERGSKYGNPLAKKIYVQENPIAKLCSAMVKQMLENTQQ